MNIVILALIATLQKEVVLLEGELAQQATQVAVVATTTVNPYIPTPSDIVPPQEIETPLLGDAPSCTLTVDNNQPIGTISWTLSGVPTSTIGTLTSDPTDGEITHLNPVTPWGYETTEYNSANMFVGATVFTADFNGIECSTTVQ